MLKSRKAVCHNLLTTPILNRIYVEIVVAQLIASLVAAWVWKSQKSDSVKIILTLIVIIAYPLYYAYKHH